MTYRTTTFLLCTLLLAVVSIAQAQPTSDFQREASFASYQSFSDSLVAVTASGDGGAVDAFWQVLKAANQVPFVLGDSIAFLYRGDANQVAWNGAWLAGKAFAAVQPMGQGEVVFLVDNTQYRMFWIGPARMVQNAVMLLPGM